MRYLFVFLIAKLYRGIGITYVFADSPVLLREGEKMFFLKQSVYNVLCVAAIILFL